MNKSIIYDMAGIGIGPFNLGLAALLHPTQEITSIFFDKNKSFNWHPGLMIEGATMQVPFYADLVTLADPSSPFSYLNYLKAKNRLIQFGIHDNNYITRKEYNHYCLWVVQQLNNLRFDHEVESVEFDLSFNCYKICFSHNNNFDFIYAKRIVCGIGTEPNIPAFAKEFLGDTVFHSSSYLHFKNELFNKRSTAIIGSGQSAAEIFYDLLLQVPAHFSQGLQWFTSSDRFFPMEISKLSHELTSPDYIEYFYGLPKHKKASILAKQNVFYKGINHSLISHIYERLYHLSSESTLAPVTLMANTRLESIRKTGDKYHLQFFHLEEEKHFMEKTEAVILATGYKQRTPAFLSPVIHRIRFDEENNFNVAINYTIDNTGNEIFIQNAELHTHGFNAPDLGMGPYRNAVIINSILGREYYQLNRGTSFQKFGITK